MHVWPLGPGPGRTRVYIPGSSAVLKRSFCLVACRRENCGWMSSSSMRLRTVPWRNALFLRILRRRCLYQGPHQHLIRCNPVGEHVPLRAIPLLELHASTSLMIAAGQGERWHQSLCPQLLERRGREAEVLDPPLHLRAGQGLVAEVAHGRAEHLRREQAGRSGSQSTARTTCNSPTSPAIIQ